ncbi:UDP-N-acetyl-D-glucosamine 2-epimerase, UDP-hydrolysing [Candidatus Kaiserbacteria bacterium RIFCSPHIGHO2_02_FULL_50_9]|uniref:UDP-N-acetyl-D-glucosamine 2-epimerase, UDP-hydrolysing n=1 Tax=Candidatus Kaiserbacteria bacterium RIFCSPLOWO2_01_FULL_51_21 TaxID=1798508 RepID=A0A1F6EEC7_9BACT|nr:MAG: UDP-N-acetyl-D-glucosamine 2-epimerase, UDP-hydrolysing [Candidatus Kaiserbacteria bacterium RIFCSPHIGHO2_01_FULL_51_33]OGG63676.1 MAG: UDP-N-acetyl-D-glucosamine 2-epimerase, UDP-hydrolysing [Candidatus Kaiserbacteria bacterium RIFCSPHIGHO2_02_FULL_50_9]OGG71977.1 MAG: UDP-N-acetyl-D-glucosamine 2-epimerase, UDP-hydrolysing [Candidatus Kaiserbacteria bacterium RIFCSPLOWO2_01_FULL_51_21]
MPPRPKKKKRKIAIIAGSRGEYGYFRPVIKEIQKRKNLDYGIITSNMHMLETFGSSIEEIKRDGLKIHASIFNTLDGYNHLTMVKSLSIFMLQLPELLKQMGADMVLLAGDRGEQLVAAIVGAHLYLPVAHIQAGEVSGNIDGVSRHAITKFAHLHFAANKDAAKRVERMGEESKRIFTVGAPMLDELVGGFVTPKKEIYRKFNLTPGKPMMLVVQHSVTEEFNDTARQIRETVEAVKRFPGFQKVIILNNSDAGSTVLRRIIMEHKDESMQVFPNVKRQDYAGLMRVAKVLVGNSSSGIIEAPTFKLPAVNIGNRERGRLCGINVIHAPHETGAIERAIKKALSPAFRKSVEKCVNPYGDGDSSRRIVDILERVPIDDTLLIKRITY